MNALSSTPSSLTRSIRHGFLALCAAAGLFLASAAVAQEKGNYLSDYVSGELGKLNEMQNNKKFDDMIGLLDKLLATAKPDSFDAATLYLFKGRVFLMKGDYKPAIDPLEKGLAISDKFKFYKQDDEQQVRLMLAQLYFQEGVAKGITIQEQKVFLKKSEVLMSRWNKVNTKANPDLIVFNAQILFTLAQCNLEVQGKTDPVYLKKAQAVMEDGLRQTAKVKESLYLFLVVCLQQQEKWVESTDYLEILTRLQPNNKQHWAQLFATYYQISQDATNTAERTAEYSIRAINTMDRAQKLGHLNTQKDNFNRVGIYFNIQQFEKATDLLDSGLRDGSIEDILKNWEILAFSYQQIFEEYKAIETLREAARRYPDKGQLHYAIAQNFYNLDKAKDAYASCLKAIKIGNLEKPYPVQSFAAYMAFELRLWDEALELINKALTFPESKKDSQISRLKVAVEDSIRDRELNKKAIEAQHKNR